MTDSSADEYDIFLSHNHNDEEWTGRLAARLEQEQWRGRKLKVFFSPWDIRPGQSIPKEIERGLLKSRKVGLVMSPEAMGSAWVELERLVTTHMDISERQERLIPLYLRDCEIPALLRPILSIDFRDPSRFEEGYRKLLAVIKGEPLPRGSSSSSDSDISPLLSIPRPPVVGFIARRDKQGRDIVARLIEELAPQKNQLIALWGAGGVGKTALAAEAANALVSVFAQRVVWVSAEGRPDFSLSTLLDETATSLGYADLRKLVLDTKKEGVRTIIAAADTLIVLDNFETIASNEQTACASYLAKQALCPVLITTRERLAGAHNVPIEAMSLSEAREFVARFIEQETHDQQAFARLNRDHLIQIAEGNPLILQWVIAQIDLAQEAQDVLDELAQGEGDAAQRVFDRSFNLPQLKDRGRDALLALTLFAPSASRPALAHVSGLGQDVRRLNKVVQPLASLWLMKATEGNQRLIVQGLTRELAKSHLLRSKKADEFRRRFVTYFVLYAEAHDQESAKDFDALEAEKDNLFNAIDVAFKQNDWKRLMRLTGAGFRMLQTRGYWDQAIRHGEQALAAAHYSGSEIGVAHFKLNLAVVQTDRGEVLEARRLCNESLEIQRRMGDEVGIGRTLHQLGWVAQIQGDLPEARRHYDESLEVKQRHNDQLGVSRTKHHLGLIAHAQGEFAEARQLYSESLEIAEKFAGQSHISPSLHQLGLLSLAEGDFQSAKDSLHRSLVILKTFGDKKNIAECLESIGNLNVAQRHFSEAESLFTESLEMAQALADQFRIGSVKHSFGILKERQGNRAEAENLFHEAMSIFEKLGAPEMKVARESLERVRAQTS